MRTLAERICLACVKGLDIEGAAISLLTASALCLTLFAACGIPPPPLRERFDRFDEGVEAMIGNCATASRPSRGTTSRSPMRAANPSRCSDRTLDALARWAQAWNVIVADGAEWRPLKDTLITRCAEIGRDPAEITCSVNVRVHGDVPVEQALAAALEQFDDFTGARRRLIVLNLLLNATPEILRGAHTNDSRRPL